MQEGFFFLCVLLVLNLLGGTHEYIRISASPVITASAMYNTATTCTIQTGFVTEQRTRLGVMTHEPAFLFHFFFFLLAQARIIEPRIMLFYYPYLNPGFQIKEV